jgi:hypothetical protein
MRSVVHLRFSGGIVFFFLTAFPGQHIAHLWWMPVLLHAGDQRDSRLAAVKDSTWSHVFPQQQTAIVHFLETPQNTLLQLSQRTKSSGTTERLPLFKFLVRSPQTRWLAPAERQSLRKIGDAPSA